MVLKKRGYKQVSLPIKLLEQIAKVIRENDELGFTSVPEFIRTAIRDNLEKFKNDNPKFEVKENLNILEQKEEI